MEIGFQQVLHSEFPKAGAHIGEPPRSTNLKAELRRDHDRLSSASDIPGKVVDEFCLFWRSSTG